MTLRLDAASLLAQERPFLYFDGVAVGTTNVRLLSERLLAQIKEQGLRRLAMVSSRVDLLVAAIAACQASRSDLLLLRTGFPDDHPNWRSWRVQGLIGDDPEVKPLEATAPSEGAGHLLLTTSGTTGMPKVVIHDLQILASRVLQTAALSAGSRWLLTFHPASFAGLQVVLTALASGGELIAASELNISSLTKACAHIQPTHVSGTPTFWRSLLLAVPPGDRSWPVRQVTVGGEPVDQSTLDQLRAAFPSARLSQIYASTEAGALFAVHDGKSGFPAHWLEQGIEGARLRIRNGVLEILSPRAMMGYLGASGGASSTDQDWFVSGDLVEVVGDRVRFCGRADDVINVGGAKVLPEDVEAVIRGLGGVREVRVYGRRSAVVGAIVCADVELAEGSDEDTVRLAIARLSASSLQPYQVPRMVRFVGAISTNASGKKTRTA